MMGIPRTPWSVQLECQREGDLPFLCRFDVTATREKEAIALAMKDARQRGLAVKGFTSVRRHADAS